MQIFHNELRMSKFFAVLYKTQLKMDCSSKSDWGSVMARERFQCFRRKTLLTAMVLQMCIHFDEALGGGYGHGGYGGGYGSSASSSSSAVAGTGGFSSGWGAKNDNGLGGGDGIPGGGVTADFIGNPFLPNANTPLPLTVHKNINLKGLTGLVGGLLSTTKSSGALTGGGCNTANCAPGKYGGSYGTGYGGSTTTGANNGGEYSYGKPYSIGEAALAGTGAYSTAFAATNPFPNSDCNSPNCDAGKSSSPSGEPYYPPTSGPLDHPKRPAADDATPCRGSNCYKDTSNYPTKDGRGQPVYPGGGVLVPCRGLNCNGGLPDSAITVATPPCHGQRCNNARPGYPFEANLPPCAAPGCKGGQPGYSPPTGTSPCQEQSCGRGTQNYFQTGASVPCNGPECNGNESNSHSKVSSTHNTGPWHPVLNPNPDGATPGRTRPVSPKPAIAMEDSNICSGGDCEKPSYLRPGVDIFNHEPLKSQKYPLPLPQTVSEYPPKQHSGIIFPDVQLPSINIKKQIGFDLNLALRPGSSGAQGGTSKDVISGFPSLNLAGAGAFAGASAASPSLSVGGAGGGNLDLGGFPGNGGNPVGDGCATGTCNNNDQEGASGYKYGYHGGKRNSYASASASAYSSSHSGFYGH